MKRTDQAILADLRAVDCALSPENLTWDGELPQSVVRRNYRTLKAKEARLLSELGRTPTLKELYP